MTQNKTKFLTISVGVTSFTILVYIIRAFQVDVVIQIVVILHVDICIS